ASRAVRRAVRGGISQHCRRRADAAQSGRASEDGSRSRPGDRSGRRLADPALTGFPHLFRQARRLAPMKFERLNVPAWPLPDFVAFNERVHGVVDPWWARVWVRRVTWLFAVLFALFAAMWLYFASTLPSAQYLLSYQPPLPTNIRGYDGTPIQTFARERRVDLSYDEIPPLVVHSFISAEDKNFFSHHGIDFTGLIGAVADYGFKSVTGGGRAKGGSTITQQVAKYLLKDSSYNVGRKAREAILAFR